MVRMKLLIALFLFSASCAFAQQNPPIRYGSTPPATCDPTRGPGELQLFWDIVNFKMKHCTATNTWSDVASTTAIASFNWQTPATADSGKWQAVYATPKTITRVYCNTDGLGTVTINLEIRPEDHPNDTGTTVLGSNLTCTGTGAGTTTINNASVPGTKTFYYIVTPIIAATSGSPGRITIGLMTE